VDNASGKTFQGEKEGEWLPIYWIVR
jgi:hypothetical protein